jgi:hypothetical protein
MDSRHYTYRVIWSDDDREFVGLCAEFPGLSWLHATMAGALKGIAAVVAAAVKDMNQAGDVVPPALSTLRYSERL